VQRLFPDFRLQLAERSRKKRNKKQLEENLPLRMNNAEQNNSEADLGKLSTRDALDSFFPASKPKLPCEHVPDSLDIFVQPNP
jgi:hypothetical protein